jgi:epoxyqueuosine reductase
VDPHGLAERVKGLALALGFDRAGIAPLGPTPESRFVREWIARGYHGEMHYLARRAAERIDPRRVMVGARSALVVGLVYDAPALPMDSARQGLAARPAAPALPMDSARQGLAARPAAPALPPEREGRDADGSSSPRGRVARYAGGEDYHDVLLERLRAVGDALSPLAGRAVRWRAYVDTGPVLERVLAAYAGLGWIGKNTCLIDPRLGSYLFLGVLLSDLELAADVREPDHCGSCRACLDACPTSAFPEPYVLDASRCLSYTTIELRGPIAEPLRAAQGDWVFGCDVCQEVCPWNRRRLRAPPSDSVGLRARLAPREEWLRPTLRWILELDEDAWRASTRRTALRRAKYQGLLRNALVAAGNSGDPALAAHVRPHAHSDDPVIAEHARWALERLGEACGPPDSPAKPDDPRSG